MEDDNIKANPSKKLKSAAPTPFIPSSYPILPLDAQNAARTEDRIETKHFIATKTQSYFITTAGGLEFIGEEEIMEKLNPTALKKVDRSGKIYFATDKPLKEVIARTNTTREFVVVLDISFKHILNEICLIRSNHIK
jgi:hypothetical protein